MSDHVEREYKMNIDSKILRLLGPNLYTNIYYILAELIANAYDADAKNVYIISKPDSIIVEDDGVGMSYSGGDIAKYLNVAVETRTTAADSLTPSGTRRKIGRKGVGKLSALSVSEQVQIKTIKNGEKSGFILSRNVKEDNTLEPLKEDEIQFERITEHGTSIVMLRPHYELNKTINAIKRNLLKIFPLINENFKIHLIQPGQEEVIDSFDKEMVVQLGGLIILGSEFYYLADSFTCDFEEQKGNLLKKRDVKTIPLQLVNKNGQAGSYDLIIKGWIGVYRSTRGRKTHPDEFSDNFISLLANNKLGEYNIIDVVGENRLNEVYVVGQLHIDLFEETELPDMALSNRQGYKTDDPRYQAVCSFARELLEEVVEMRTTYATCKRKNSDLEKIKIQRAQEEELKRKVNDFKRETSAQATRKIVEKLDINKNRAGEVEKIIENEINTCSTIVGIKSIVDAQKKKILLSHTGVDKDLADIIYNMLVFNNILPEDIIYTSCNDAASRIPDSLSIFDYLREFFVESISNQMMFVIYVTSKEMAHSWGAVTEAGAGWITKVDHKLFNIHDHRPEPPLNIAPAWHTSIRNSGRIGMTKVECDRFVIKIEEICNTLGYSKKTKDQNLKELLRFVDVI